jgi:hypothetical protein
VFTFHRPETLAALATDADTLRVRLAQMPFKHPLPAQNLRECQVEAITNLEQSFAADRPRALIQMILHNIALMLSGAISRRSGRGAPRALQTRFCVSKITDSCDDQVFRVGVNARLSQGRPAPPRHF